MAIITAVKQYESVKSSNVQNKVQANNVSPKQELTTKPAFTFSQVMFLKSNSLAFKGIEEKTEKDFAQESLNLVSDLIKQGKKLDSGNSTHTKNIADLGKVLGGKPQNVLDINNPGNYIEVKNGLDINNLNKDGNLEVLKRTLEVMLSATENNPEVKNMGTYELHVNNPKLSPLIKLTYDAESFGKLFNTLDKNGVFNIQTHPVLGTPKTSGVTEGEDFEMGARYWITDSCHNVELMKDQDPNAVPKAIKTIARFYKENENAIQRFVDQPILENKNNPNHPINMVKAGNLEDAKLLGVPHIFIPIEDENSKDGIMLKLDETFNRWRQESHGNALKSIVNAIREGVIEHKNTGLKSEDINKDVIDTIGNLVSYFKSIDYPNAPSGGNWEEEPFVQGLTYDTAVIADALKTTKQLMSDLKNSSNPECKELRDKLINSKNGKILGNEQELNSLIKIGEDRVKRTFLEEAPAAAGVDSRKYDASQAFTVRIAKFDEDPIKDAQKKFEVLEGIEKNLVGDFGIARYNEKKKYVGSQPEIAGDSYLGPDYDTAVDKDGKLNLGYFDIKSQFGSKDCSTATLFNAREKICGGSKEQTAQWFFDPVMASAYDKIKEDLLKAGVSEDDALVKKASEERIKYLNRGIARVTGARADETEYLKSNGHLSHEWSVPEAYQAVTSLENDEETGNKKTKFVVGRNSPLTWAEKELYIACKDYQKSLA